MFKLYILLFIVIESTDFFTGDSLTIKSLIINAHLFNGDFIKPILQVALDVLEIDRALQIAKEAIEGGADWIEAGTPLIKSEGMDAIRKLKEAFPGYVILADMKTMDTGAMEVEMAAKAGARSEERRVGKECRL